MLLSKRAFHLREEFHNVASAKVGDDFILTKGACVIFWMIYVAKACSLRHLDAGEHFCRTVCGKGVLRQGNVAFVKEQEMTPRKYINELSGFERLIFSKLYAGGFSKKLYRLFEYEKK